MQFTRFVLVGAVNTAASYAIYLLLLAVADYRMEEGKGGYVHDYAGGFGPLELHKAEWVTDGGRPALKFGEGKAGRHRRAASGAAGLRGEEAAGGVGG